MTADSQRPPPPADPSEVEPGPEATEPGRAIRLAAAAAPAEGGEAACFAHLVCPECGAVVTEGHRPGCAAELSP